MIYPRAPASSASYTFSSTANDGRIQERQDHISGEKVLYQYDQLGRLLSAATEGAGGWGLAWVFDGYGNLRQQNVTKCSLTGFSFSINASTNRINGQTYDANGNWTAQWPMYQTYDIENRISAVIGNQSQQNESYLYSGRNERMVVTRGTENGLKRLHFYGADGLLLGVYRLEIAEQTVHSFAVRLPDQERLYFGGRLMQIGGEWVATDRLGSVVRKGTTNYKYAPYGQEISGATANDTNKFATYTRDSLSGLDYALNRYYKPEWGRFTSPDPYQASGSPADPGSWNRYAYVGGDPVNFNDPLGLDAWVVPFGESMPLFPRKPPGSGGVGGGGGEGGKDKYAPDEGSEDWHAELAASTAAMWMAELLKEAVSAAVSLIRTKDSCRSLFADSYRVNTYFDGDPAALLEALNSNSLITIKSSYPNAANPSSQVRVTTAFAGPHIGAVTVPAFGSISHNGTPVSYAGVVINSGGFFFTGYINGVTVQSNPENGFAGLSYSQMQSAVILHELGHVTGVFGPDMQPPGASQAHSRTVRERCF